MDPSYIELTDGMRARIASPQNGGTAIERALPPQTNQPTRSAASPAEGTQRRDCGAPTQDSRARLGSFLTTQAPKEELPSHSSLAWRALAIGSRRRRIFSPATARFQDNRGVDSKENQRLGEAGERVRRGSANDVYGTDG